MTKIRNVLGFTIALAMTSAPVFAATATKPDAKAAKAATAKPATKPAAKPASVAVAKPVAVPAKPMVAAVKPAAKPVAAPAVHVAAAKPAVRVAAHPVAQGRMVTTKTSTGKTITYNCSLAGNATKTACKG